MLLRQVALIFLNCNHFLSAISDDLVENIFFVSQQLYFHEESATKIRVLPSLRDSLEAQNIIFALLGAKLDFLQIHLSFKELVKVEALLLSHEVLGKRCLASAPSHDLVVSHLNVELKLALGIRVLVAHVVIVEHKGLAPGHFRGLSHVFSELGLLYAVRRRLTQQFLPHGGELDLSIFNLWQHFWLGSSRELAASSRGRSSRQRFRGDKRLLLQLLSLSIRSCLSL